jgi:DNA-binding MarR family transcriptional regulator
LAIFVDDVIQQPTEYPGGRDYIVLRHLAIDRRELMTGNVLTAADYAVLADFRHTLRRFLAFSETKAGEFGLTPQQHQALLAIKACGPDRATVGYLAEKLILKPHSASGLIDRLEAMDLLARRTSPHDRRQAQLVLSDRAEKLLADLSATHLEEIRRLRPMLAGVLNQIGT